MRKAFAAAAGEVGTLMEEKDRPKKATKEVSF